MSDKKPAGFGFAALSQIKPEAPPTAAASAESVEKIDRAADRLGFSSREPTQLRRRSRPEEPQAQFNIRASMKDINRFIGFCEENRYSYREGFGELVKLIK